MYIANYGSPYKRVQRFPPPVYSRLPRHIRAKGRRKHRRI